MEKSPSRNAASKFESVRKGNITRLCAENAKLSQAMTIATVRVHCSLEEKLPVHSRIKATSVPPSPAARASSKIRRS